MAKFYFFVILSVIAFSLSAQDTLRVFEKEVIDKILKQNLQIKISVLDADMASADYEQSTAVYLPNVNLNYSGATTTNPLMAFGFKLNQEILTAADFNPTLLNNPKRTSNFSSKVEVQQPILNLDGIYQRKAARTQTEAMKLKTQRVEESVKMEAEKTYLQLQLSYLTEKTVKKALQAIVANKIIITDYYKNGLIQKTDVLQIEVREGEAINQLKNVQTNIANLSDYMFFLANDSISTAIVKPLEPLVQNPAVELSPTLNPNRTDLLLLNYAVQGQKHLLTASKMKFLPRLNAFGSYEWYDDKPFQMNASGYLVGFQLSWNVFDGLRANGNLKKQKLEYGKILAQKAQYQSKSQMENVSLQRKLADAESNIQVNRLAVAQMQDNYRIKINRYKEGLEKTSDLLNAEAQLYKKELDYNQSVYDYKILLLQLKYLNQ